MASAVAAALLASPQLCLGLIEESSPTGVLEGLWLRAPHTGTIKGTQSDLPAEGSTRSGGGWEKPPWEPPQTEMLSQTLPSFIDFSFLNSTSCSDKKTRWWKPRL